MGWIDSAFTEVQWRRHDGGSGFSRERIVSTRYRFFGGLIDTNAATSAKIAARNSRDVATPQSSGSFDATISLQRRPSASSTSARATDLRIYECDVYIHR